MSLPAGSPTPPDRIDPRALLRLRSRLLHAPERPWLHQEAARRMAERLPLIRQVPQRALDWSADAPDIDPVLRTALPSTRLARVVEGADEAPAAAGWWQRLLPRSQPLVVSPVAAAAEPVDLVWSNMRLHLAPDPVALMKQWRAALAADGFLMCTTWGPGSLPELRELYRSEGWGPAHAPFVDMHDLGDMMVEAGLADPVMDQETLTLTYSSPDRLLAELRELGLNADPARFAGLRTAAWRQRLHQALAARAGKDGRIAVTWELVHGHAFRAPDRGPDVAPNTTIALDEFKLMLRKPSSRQ